MIYTFYTAKEKHHYMIYTFYTAKHPRPTAKA